MEPVFLQRSIASLIVAAALLVASTAYATLGGKADSVETVRAAFSANRHADVAQPNYTVHEVANDGLTIREYENKDGTIFAVTWSGVSHPDLTSLLGTYLADFSQAAQAAPKTHGRAPYSETHGAKVVVKKWGHMRAVHGRAYLPSLLPAGVNADELN